MEEIKTQPPTLQQLTLSDLSMRLNDLEIKMDNIARSIKSIQQQPAPAQEPPRMTSEQCYEAMYGIKPLAQQQPAYPNPPNYGMMNQPYHQPHPPAYQAPVQQERCRACRSPMVRSAIPEDGTNVPNTMKCLNCGLIYNKYA